MEKKTQTVLIVDDQSSFILSLVTGLKAYCQEYDILTAENGADAVEVLETSPVDLVVTDLRMPGMDGFELLAYMSSNFPSIPAIVMSAYGTRDIKTRLSGQGFMRFIEKPLDFNDLADAINEGLSRTTDEDFIRDINIGNFIQLIEMEKKTCILNIYEGRTFQSGALYFNKGELYDAECDDATGRDAALKIIGWENTEIKCRELPKKKIVRRIYDELVPLIMEATRLRDEMASIDETVESDIQGGQNLEVPMETNESEFESDTGAMDSNSNTETTNKEIMMNIRKLNEAIEKLKEDMGESLIGTDIFGSADGQSICGYNGVPKASALFAQLIRYLTKSLESSGFPKLGNYFLMDLADHKLGVCIPLGDYIWAILADKTKIQLGMLLNVIMPDVIDAFEDAIAD